MLLQAIERPTYAFFHYRYNQVLAICVFIMSTVAFSSQSSDKVAAAIVGQNEETENR